MPTPCHLVTADLAREVLDAQTGKHRQHVVSVITGAETGKQALAGALLAWSKRSEPVLLSSVVVWSISERLVLEDAM